MATRTEVVLIDDIDGAPADETVQLELDGRKFEIDLSSQNAVALRASLQAYVDAARRVTRRSKTRRRA